MTSPKTLGVIFMGGQGRRMGGLDKSEIMVGNETCFDRVFAVLSKDSDKVVLSRPYGGNHSIAPVIPDWPTAAAQSSPALALLGCLSYASSHGFIQILTSAVDTPFLPATYFNDLATPALSACVETNGHIHGLHARWSCAQLPKLKSTVLGGQHKIGKLHQLFGSDIAAINSEPYDPFFNINHPQDLASAQSLAQHYQI